MSASLPINIESLLSGKAVENNRLDYKEGWNPDSVYRNICLHTSFNDTSILNNQDGNLTGNLREFYIAMQENPNKTVSVLFKIVKGEKNLQIN